MEQIYQTNKVFTPTQPAINSFVERASKISNHLVDALLTPGKQIVIYGHSGCGKTTLVINKLNQTYESIIITRCMEGMSFENILLDGFDQLGQVISETANNRTFKVSPAVTLTYNEIKATISIGEYSNQKATSHKLILPPQLTAQRLGKFFGEAKTCWILEDFHKIKGQDKTRTSQLMKVFMDMSYEYPELKIIAIGAVGTARQVIEYDREMNNRVSEIYVPYMKSSEIEAIIQNGEKLLNLHFIQKVKDKIVKYSCGLPSICHQLCLNVCFSKRIYSTSKSKLPITINSDDLDEAIEKYIDEKSDTLQAEFDKAVKVPNNNQFNLPSQILKAALEINKDQFTFDAIHVKLKQNKRKEVKASEVEKMLEELCMIKRGEILVFDDNSNKYRFNNLFLKAYTQLQFKEDEPEVKMLTDKNRRIVDRLLEIIESDLSSLDDFYISDYDEN